jgi:hypothetical protein
MLAQSLQTRTQGLSLHVSHGIIATAVACSLQPCTRGVELSSLDCGFSIGLHVKGRFWLVVAACIPSGVQITSVSCFE